MGILGELGLTAERLGDPFVVVVEDGGQRAQEGGGEESALRFRKIQGEFFDFGGGGHGGDFMRSCR